MKVPALLLAAAISIASSAVGGEPGFLPQTETDAIVLKFQTAYADTFDRRDAQGMAALLTEDSTLQNEWGDVTRGRGNIEALLGRLMGNLQAGTRLEDTPLVSHAVAADVIISQGISHRIVPGEPPGSMFFTRVLVRENGQWKLAATQIARPSTVPKPGTPAPAK